MTKDQLFSPTPAMSLYAMHRGRLGKKAKDSEISKLIGIRKETISRWKNINGFGDWLETEITLYRAPIHDVLEMVARSRIEDFRFWEALAKKYGYLAPDGDAASEPRVIRLAYSIERDNESTKCEQPITTRPSSPINASLDQKPL